MAEGSGVPYTHGSLDDFWAFAQKDFDQIAKPPACDSQSSEEDSAADGEDVRDEDEESNRADAGPSDYRGHHTPPGHRQSRTPLGQTSFGKSPRYDFPSTIRSYNKRGQILSMGGLVLPNSWNRLDAHLHMSKQLLDDLDQGQPDFNYGRILQREQLEKGFVDVGTRDLVQALHVRSAWLGLAFQCRVGTEMFYSYDHSHSWMGPIYDIVITTHKGEPVHTCHGKLGGLRDVAMKLHVQMDKFPLKNPKHVKKTTIYHWYELVGHLPIPVCISVHPGLVNDHSSLHVQQFQSNCMTIQTVAEGSGQIALDFENTPSGVSVEGATTVLATLGVHLEGSRYAVVIEPYPWPNLQYVLSQKCTILT